MGAEKKSNEQRCGEKDINGESAQLFRAAGYSTGNSNGGGGKQDCTAGDLAGNQRNVQANYCADKRKNGWFRFLCFVLLAAVILLLNRHFGWTAQLSGGEMLAQLKQVLADNLALALLIYCVLTVIACVVLALPGITFALLAGMLFGPVLGTLACLFACTLGASLAFLIGRFFLRDAVAPLLEKNRLLKKLLFSGNERNDIVVLMITRLVPLFPYNLQNFAYGITEMRFTTYTVFSFLFMAPGVALYTIGAAGITDRERRFLYFGIAALLFAAVMLLGALIKKKFLPEQELSEEELSVKEMPEQEEEVQAEEAEEKEAENEVSGIIEKKHADHEK